MNDFPSAVDKLIFGCFITSADIILQGRRANFLPKRNKTNQVFEYTSNSDFCAQSLNSWKRDITIPLFFDVSILQGQSQQILIERWKFNFQRRDELKDGRSGAIKKRIVTFLRTFYSFIRLLPGYQILNLVSYVPNLLFDITTQEIPHISKAQLESDSWDTYDFPIVSTGKGVLSVTVNYLSPVILEVSHYAYIYSLIGLQTWFLIYLFFLILYSLYSEY